MYECSHCNYKTNYQSNWIRHQSTEKHTENTKKFVKPKCEFCNKSFATEYTLMKHMEKSCRLKTQYIVNTENCDTSSVNIDITNNTNDYSLKMKLMQLEYEKQLLLLSHEKEIAIIRKERRNRN